MNTFREQLRQPQRRTRLAFTLIELLVVISIMALLATIAIPAFKGFGRSNIMAAANRQLLDDLAGARARAIGLHTTVYMVFVSPDIINTTKFPLQTGPVGAQMTNLYGGQFNTYALLTLRSVGDQPGQSSPRYLTSWRTLPSGVFIAASKFAPCKNTDPAPLRAFSRALNSKDPNRVPFPTATNSLVPLAFIGFDYLGRLIPRSDDTGAPFNILDEYIPLARGSIFYARDAANRSYVPQPADVQENPPFNSVNNSNVVHIDWLTGRARIERQELQ